MQVPFDAVMTEAFRRAQMRGRVFPQTCDFPPSVSTDELERTYLPPLHALCGAPVSSQQKADNPVFHCGPMELTAFPRDTDDASFLTNGGDAWAAVLLLEEDV
ncbi:hypothetical protein ABB37_02992 [Leptomonas pyrrhocoris]|uniref:Uncharacterized protein n=1 Tax=Leptomonas pyrrhocoris TaxID=157538 RepID=A0A0M9G6E3_LEPPY|nr:hypothetical protein ABB37_02992 [Leptomonas pyrrhocoris]XP_015661777.1 hypothetical protein ABB37_02992 [Leptomonas pyrrhocoris]KPA83337.1 hypothetical protein ABB37_02992 [Leptomonas pyrrhocoris]KPA83338.1 hypothetical protein ABB37_02992 [Leptomonas pyrrhocoris]|eukprot:XP_015661776.1 hypothetical protein ABB37_02992 [Leptomonas pyrrhocoris]